MDKMRLKFTMIATVVALLVFSIGLESPRRAAAGNGAGPNVTCMSPNPCLSETNTSTGTAITGISKKGSGIIGETKFNSTSQSNSQIGVLGEDLSTTGNFNFGILGSSTNGAGVFGISNAGDGVQAYSGALDAVRVTVLASVCTVSQATAPESEPNQLPPRQNHFLSGRTALDI